MKKAPDAFRTISEVAEILDTPAHVLRFWESKFYQIRPVKRAGGRRYYRPDDVALINGIKTLLQDQGLTIRGVQRVLQEQGVKHVAGLGGPLPELDDADLEDAGLDDTGLGDIGLADQVFEPQDADEPPSAPRSDLSIDDAEPADEPIPAPATQPVDRRDALTPLDTEDDAPTLPLDEPAIEDAELDDLPQVAANAEAPPAGTVTLGDEDPTEALDLAPAATPDITPDAESPAPPEPRPAEAPIAAAARQQAELDALEAALEPPDRTQIARALRQLPRGRLGARRDRVEMLARRIDLLLERMSEASGAGRW